MFFNPLTTGRARASAARSVALALICGHLAGCTIERAVQEPPLQRFVWYRFLNGDDLRETWQLDRTFTPAPDRSRADAAHARWTDAVERSKGWAAG